MVGVLAGVAGLVLGVAVTWALSLRRSESLREDVVRAASALAVRDSQLAAASEQLERQRVEHAHAIENMEKTFENLSNRVLNQTVAQFSQSQEDLVKLRESKLDSTLRPLEDLLGEYKKNLADFNTLNAGALSDVKNKAEELLSAQLRTQEETRRLNALLGRSSQRGAWGEIQLANVMAKSDLREGIDFELQVSGTAESGQAQRPDCVVNLPNGIRLAVDAKFPFAAFEASLDTEDAEARRELQHKHARDLRGHVKALKEKGYWEAIAPAPEFTVCFVPSDAAITAAFEADPKLHGDATNQRVIIAGPTTLLSLLWSVAVIVQQHQVAFNAEQIYKIADTIFERIRNVAEPVAKMGKSIDSAVKDYNAMLSSIEGRLIPAAKNVRLLGGTKRARELPELEPVDRLPNSLNEGKWGVGDDNALPEGVSEILELEGVEQEDQKDDE
jgi:DNA recombination protein RmuC